MVDLNVVAAKLAEISARLARIRSLCPADEKAMAGDQDALELVSFNLILVIQACLDISSHIIADQGWRSAGTLVESFVRLHEHKVISAETLAGIRPGARLRNILTQMDSTVDATKVHRAATLGLVELERFAAEVGAWVRGLWSAEEEDSQEKT